MSGSRRLGGSMWGITTAVALFFILLPPSSASLAGSQPASGGLCFAPGAWATRGFGDRGPPPQGFLNAAASRRSVLGDLRGKWGGGKEQGPGILRAAKAATLGLFLLGAALLPPSRQASASADDGFAMGADGTMPLPSRHRVGKIGAAAGASVLTFGSACAIAIKKEKRRCQGDREELEKDLARLNSFKEEFLEGKISDRSLYSSLKKKTNTSDEDEFDRNVRAFLEEEENKKKGKKEPKHKESPTVLERPGEKDPDDGDDVDDIDNKEDHSPADIDDSVRAMLEKMLGGGGEGDKK